MEVQHQFRAITSVSLQAKVNCLWSSSAGRWTGAADPALPGWRGCHDVTGAWEFQQVSHGGWKEEFSMGQELEEKSKVALCGLTEGAALLQCKGDWRRVLLHLWWHEAGTKRCTNPNLYFRPLANSPV